jgi:hypothetical protein
LGRRNHRDQISKISRSQRTGLRRYGICGECCRVARKSLHLRLWNCKKELRFQGQNARMSENEFIARAADALERAEAANNEAERQTWLVLAESWLLISRYEQEPGWRSRAKPFNRDDARRIVAKVLKLPELVRPD